MYVNESFPSVYRDPSNLRICITCNDGTSYIIERSDSRWDDANEFYKACFTTPKASRTSMLFTLPSCITSASAPVSEITAVPLETPAVPPVEDKAKLLEDGLEALINFFTEFQFTPSFRFTNTLAYIAQDSFAAVQRYVCHYFELMGSNYVDDIGQKIKSAEFKALIKKIAQYGTPSTPVNTRFKVYFGAAGTGKTTLAQTETENRCIVCNSSMLPSDLMENFVFKDGKPDFNPSILWECMEQGKPIVLDEINLLPFDSLRFLQGIADGKTSFIYKNREVHIANGFKIIGTMNLTLGGVTYGLPEPLVDRCEDIREFNLSAKQLMGAITGNVVVGK